MSDQSKWQVVVVTNDKDRINTYVYPQEAKDFWSLMAMLNDRYSASPVIFLAVTSLAEIGGTK